MPDEPTREVESTFLVALWEFSLEYTLALAHRMHKKCHRLTRLVLTADPSPCLFVCSFLPPSRLHFYVGKEMWNIPGQRWEKPVDDYDGHEWFKEAELVGSAGSYWHTHTHTHTHIYIYIWRKINGKVDQLSTDTRFQFDISSLFQKDFHQKDQVFLKFSIGGNW